MATRVYPHAAAGLWRTVSPDAAWDLTSGYVQRGLTTILNADAALSSTVAASKAVTGPNNLLVCQYVLPYLAAQTITGEVKGQFRVLESNAAMDAHVQTVIRVVDPVSLTVRGALLAASATVAISSTPGADNYEIANSATNRKVPAGWSGAGTALSSVDAEEGDWLVVELGARFFDITAAGRTVTFSTFRNPANADYAEDETSTATANCWLEFSDTLTFAPTADVYDPADLMESQRFPNLAAPPPSEGQTWPRGGGSW